MTGVLSSEILEQDQLVAMAAKAESLVKQPLPAPYDNREYGFASERG